MFQRRTWSCTNFQIDRLGPAYNEFGYNEHPTITSRFLWPYSLTAMLTRKVHSHIQKSPCNRNWRRGDLLSSSFGGGGGLLSSSKAKLKKTEKIRCFSQSQWQKTPPPPGFAVCVWAFQFGLWRWQKTLPPFWFCHWVWQNTFFYEKRCFFNQSDKRPPPPFPLSCFSGVASLLDTFHPPVNTEERSPGF